MTLVWRYGVVCGVVIAVVDLISAIASAGQPETSQQLALAQTLDQIANVFIYSFCGYQVGKATGVVRMAAEAGVLAGLLVGIAAIVVGQFIPPVGGSGVDVLVGVLALNVAMSGILATAAGFLGSRVADQKR